MIHTFIFFALVALIDQFAAAVGNSHPCGYWTGELHLLSGMWTTSSESNAQFNKLASFLMEQVQKDFHGSKFAVSYFCDKPLKPFGDPEDWCYNNLQPMTHDASLITRAVNAMPRMKGGDFQGAQFDALYHGIMSRKVGWTNETYDDKGHPYFRVLIMATDEYPHYDGDLRKEYPDKSPHDGSPEPNCLKFDYPSMELIRTAFQSKNVRPLFLVRDATEGQSVIQRYSHLVAEIGQGGHVLPVDADPQHIMDVIKELVGCQEERWTSETEANTTTVSTTAAVGGAGRTVTLAVAGGGFVIVAAACGAIVVRKIQNRDANGDEVEDDGDDGDSFFDEDEATQQHSSADEDESTLQSFPSVINLGGQGRLLTKMFTGI